jgi:ketosteroid isomerase-like protein
MAQASHIGIPARTETERIARRASSLTGILVGVSENLELVRSIYVQWERGDFRRIDWADPHIELVIAEGLEGDSFNGLDAAAKGWREWLSGWDGYRAHAHEYRDLDADRVLVLGRMNGRGRISGIRSETETANVFHVRGGRVVRLTLYRDRTRAFADLGLDG